MTQSIIKESSNFHLSVTGVSVSQGSTGEMLIPFAGLGVTHVKRIGHLGLIGSIQVFTS